MSYQASSLSRKYPVNMVQPFTLMNKIIGPMHSQWLEMSQKVASEASFVCFWSIRISKLEIQTTDTLRQYMLNYWLKDEFVFYYDVARPNANFACHNKNVYDGQRWPLILDCISVLYSVLVIVAIIISKNFPEEWRILLLCESCV